MQEQEWNYECRLGLIATAHAHAHVHTPARVHTHAPVCTICVSYVCARTYSTACQLHDRRARAPRHCLVRASPNALSIRVSDDWGLLFVCAPVAGGDRVSAYACVILGVRVSKGDFLTERVWYAARVADACSSSRVVCVYVRSGSPVSKYSTADILTSVGRASTRTGESNVSRAANSIADTDTDTQVCGYVSAPTQRAHTCLPVCLSVCHFCLSIKLSISMLGSAKHEARITTYLRRAREARAGSATLQLVLAQAEGPAHHGQSNANRLPDPGALCSRWP